MATSAENLRQLTDQLRNGNQEALGPFQEELHPGLVLVIRRALRTGAGGAALKRWLGRALSAMPPTDGADPSDALALMLGNGLARQFNSEPKPAISSAETVVS